MEPLNVGNVVGFMNSTATVQELAIPIQALDLANRTDVRSFLQGALGTHAKVGVDSGLGFEFDIVTETETVVIEYLMDWTSGLGKLYATCKQRPSHTPVLILVEVYESDDEDEIYAIRQRIKCSVEDHGAVVLFT
jgi:hypothetical protein